MSTTPLLGAKQGAEALSWGRPPRATESLKAILQWNNTAFLNLAGSKEDAFPKPEASDRAQNLFLRGRTMPCWLMRCRHPSPIKAVSLQSVYLAAWAG